MNHWLTVHFPRELDAGATDGRKGVWISSDRIRDFDHLANEDLVAVYETKGGPRRRLHFPDGTSRRSCYVSRRGGIIAVGRVVERHQRPEITRAIHDDGEEISWAKLATLELLPTEGFIARARLAQTLGYKAGWVPRGFGGLRTITREEFQEILSDLEPSPQ